MKDCRKKSGLNASKPGQTGIDGKHTRQEMKGSNEGVGGQRRIHGRPDSRELTGTRDERDNGVKMADLVALQEEAGWLGERKGPDKMAELIALQRHAESSLPEERRIFFDPYAIRFIDPHVLEWGRTHPEEATALAEEFERKMPGFSNSIRARVRYFDDFVRDAAGRGFSQLVILGAGYDTRAYRIDALKNCVQVFEVDHPLTQMKKTGTIAGIFNAIPDHVVFVPVDLECDNLWDAMEWYGYSPVEKTLFVMEGLLMYLSQEAVRDLLSGIADRTIDGSIILFDFLPRALAGDDHHGEGGKNILDYTVMTGEPIRSGFSGDDLVTFLTGLGYSRVKITRKKEYRKQYFTGVNADRRVSSLLSFASATVLRTRGENP